MWLPFFSTCKEIRPIRQKHTQQTQSRKHSHVPGKHRRLSHFSRRSSRNAAISSDHVYTILDRQWYCVRLETDEKDCEVSGLCQLVDGYVIVVDSANCNAKMLDDEAGYAVMAHCNLPEFPRDVCVIGDTEVAVTVSEVVEMNRSIKNEIHFLGLIDGNLEATKVLKMPHLCRDIAHHQGHLYVSDCNTIYKYTTGGQLVKKIYQNKSGECTIERMVISNDGSRLHITNRDANQLLTMDVEGRHVTSLEDVDIALPTAMCVSKVSGHVFLCGQWSNTIIQVEKDGRRKLTTLAIEEDGVEFPQTAMFDSHASAVVLGQWESDHILVLKLK